MILNVDLMTLFASSFKRFILLSFCVNVKL